MRRFTQYLLLVLVCLGSCVALGESADTRNEVIEKYEAQSQQEKQGIIDRYTERIAAEQSSCGGKVAKLKCAIEKATWADWLFVFGAVGVFYFVRFAYDTYITERRTQQTRDPHWLIKQSHRKRS